MSQGTKANDWFVMQKRAKAERDEADRRILESVFGSPRKRDRDHRNRHAEAVRKAQTKGECRLLWEQAYTEAGDCVRGAKALLRGIEDQGHWLWDMGLHRFDPVVRGALEIADQGRDRRSSDENARLRKQFISKRRGQPFHRRNVTDGPARIRTLQINPNRKR